MTQAELADQVGLTQGHLSKLERFQTPIEERLLERIAEATSTPRSFLVGDAFGINEGSLRFRKQSKARAGDTKQVARLIVEVYRVCIALAAARRLPPPVLPIADGPDRFDRTAIEELAQRTRNALQVPEGAPVGHVTRALERAGVFVVPLILPDADPDAETVGHMGASTWRGPWESALIGYFPTSPGDRQRFTLAHELGHLVLHGQRTPLPATAEAEANEFAGAFLVPEDSMRAAIAVGQVTLGRLQALKAGWGVAIQALIMRASQLDLIDDARKQSLFVQLTARGWRKSEPVKVHPENPLLLRTLLVRTYGDPIRWGQAASELGLRESILQSVAPSQFTSS